MHIHKNLLIAPIAALTVVQSDERCVESWDFLIEFNKTRFWLHCVDVSMEWLWLLLLFIWLSIVNAVHAVCAWSKLNIRERKKIETAAIAFNVSLCSSSMAASNGAENFTLLYLSIRLSFNVVCRLLRVAKLARDSFLLMTISYQQIKILFTMEYSMMTVTSMLRRQPALKLKYLPRAQWYLFAQFFFFFRRDYVLLCNFMGPFSASCYVFYVSLKFPPNCHICSLFVVDISDKIDSNF